MTESPNIITKVDGYFQEAIEECAQGEDVRYALSVTIGPAPDQQSLIPLLVIIVSIPGVTIGDRLNVTTLNENLEPRKDQVVAFLRETLEGLRAKRTEMIKEVIPSNLI